MRGEAAVPRTVSTKQKDASLRYHHIDCISLAILLLFDDDTYVRLKHKHIAKKKVEFVKEVLAVIEWRSPFDDSVKQDFHEALLQTDMWADFGQNIRLFSSKAETDKDWSEVKSFTESLSVIFGAIGIKICSSFSRPRINGVKTRRLYTYAIDSSSAKQLAEQINAVTQMQITSINSHAESFLRHTGLPFDSTET